MLNDTDRNTQRLIHMNGRVYDYNLGRFLSVDPFIQAPTNTQSVNPYSYIMNNPLAGTDPTGYAWVCPPGFTACHHDNGFSAGSTGSKPAKAPANDNQGAISESADRSDVSNGADNRQEAQSKGSNFSSDDRAQNLQSSGGDLREQIRSDAHRQIMEGGAQFGVDMGSQGTVELGSVEAEWAGVEIDVDGNVLSAEINCSKANKTPII